MTDILSMINRLQDTAIDFTLSGRERDRDELHAARRAIMERVEELQAEAELNEMMAHDLAGEAVVATIKRAFPAIAAKWEAYSAPPASEREAELVKALTSLEAQLQALDWHRINRTVNGEIFAGIIKSAIGDCRAALHPSLEQE